MKFWTAFAALLCALAFGAPAQAQSEWDNVARVVVIGDLHGEYDKFVDMLRAAQLIDEHDNWAGGETHLVQLGDVPDRAPDTRRIMDLLMRLEPQARRAGGYVHALIGNHEAMNVEGDLRYTTAGEFAAFADRGSSRRRDSFYRATVNYLRAHPPEGGAPAFDRAYRAQWDEAHPLGWVEHRQAWAPSGRYGGWVAGHDAVIRINDMLFMHGGLGPSYETAGREPMNEAVRAALRGEPEAPFEDILTAEDGPLWYRGLALNAEDAERPHLEALLAQHHVAHIVVGHTKAFSTVMPRFGGRVLLTDIAVPRGYDDPHAFLVIENGAEFTVHRGQRVPLGADTPEAVCAYLGRIAAIDGGAGPVAALAGERCAAPAQ